MKNKNPIAAGPQLQTVLKYKNANVVRRFALDFNVTERQSQLIFEDCLSFLWLSYRHLYLSSRASDRVALCSDFGMIEELFVLDEMWHTFLLFSESYAGFSKKYFGQFLHHEPEINNTGTLAPTDMDNYKKFVSQELGSAVSRRWFHNYSEIYSKKQLLKRKYLAANKKN